MRGGSLGVADLDLARGRIGGGEVEDTSGLGLNLGAVTGRFLEVADGVIVGSGLKVDGHTWNPVDRARAGAFMDRVREARRS